MVTVESLSKRFGRIVALEDVTFRIPDGAVVGLLGVNGAGKTTLMRIVAGYLAPGTGSVRIGDGASDERPVEVRRRIGYMPESTPLYPEMRVEEYLRFRGRLKGLAGRRLRESIKLTIRQCGLEEVQRRLIGRLSRGYRQRLGLADALLHDPDLLVLDEPIANLDPNQRRALHGLIDALRGKRTVLLSSHILTDVESLCQQVIILHKGRVVADGSPGLLRGGLLGLRVTEAEGRCNDLAAADRNIGVLSGRLGAAGREVTMTPLEDGHFRLKCVTETGYDPREALFAWAVESGVTLRELHMRRLPLDAVFAALTERPTHDSEIDAPSVVANGKENVDNLAT